MTAPSLATEFVRWGAASRPPVIRRLEGVLVPPLPAGSRVTLDGIEYRADGHSFLDVYPAETVMSIWVRPS